MKIGVDFDRVIFDTDEFNRALKSETGLQHVEADVYDEKGDYSPEKHAEACGIDPEKIYDFMEKGLERFVFDDVKQLSRLEHELWIVTRGEEKFQREKVENSDIKESFDRIEIVESGTKDVGIDFLVDDREKELEMADIPGFVLERPENSMKDAIEAVRNYEA